MGNIGQVSALLKVTFNVTTTFLILTRTSYMYPKYQKNIIFHSSEIENFLKMVSRKNGGVREFLRNFHSVWYVLAHFWQKFRESNVLTKEINR